MKIIDHYSGYEGEPEVKVLDERGSVLLCFWEGHFDEIMENVPVTEQGWTGLLRAYHLCENWDESEPWKIPDVEGTYRQIAGICTERLTEEAAAVWKDMTEVLHTALADKKNLYLLYE